MGTIILTGANGSLAIPAVDYLLSKYPSCTALLTVRDDSEKDANTQRLRTVIAKYPDAQYSIRKLDLASLSAVHSFAGTIHTDVAARKLQPLIAIICNAFTWDMSSTLKFTEDGYERAMGVNHVAQFDLVLRLLRDMDPQHGRIVFLSSESHWPGKAGFEKFSPTVPEDLEVLVKPSPDKVGEEVGRGFQRYGLSKLVIVMTMYELNRRLKASQDLRGISALAVDPGGLVDSRAFGYEHVPYLWQWMIAFANLLQPLLKYLMPNMRRSSEAARDMIELAVGTQYAGQEGHFERDHKADSSPESHDEDVQLALWNKSVEWGKLNQKDTALAL